MNRPKRLGSLRPHVTLPSTEAVQHLSLDSCTVKESKFHRYKVAKELAFIKPKLQRGPAMGTQKRFDRSSPLHPVEGASIGHYDLHKTSMAYESYYSLRGSSLCDTSNRFKMAHLETESHVGPGTYNPELPQKKVFHAVTDNHGSPAPSRNFSLQQEKRRMEKSAKLLEAKGKSCNSISHESHNRKASIARKRKKTETMGFYSTPSLVEHHDSCIYGGLSKGSGRNSKETPLPNFLSGRKLCSSSSF